MTSEGGGSYSRSEAAKLGPKHGHMGPTQTGSILLLHQLNCPEPAPVARTFLSWAVLIPILRMGQPTAGPVGQGPCLGPCTGGWPQTQLPGSLWRHGFAHLRDLPRKASPYMTLGTGPSPSPGGRYRLQELGKYLPRWLSKPGWPPRPPTFLEYMFVDLIKLGGGRGLGERKPDHREGPD